MTAKSFDVSSPLLYIITEIYPSGDQISGELFKGHSSIRSKIHPLKCHWSGVPVFAVSNDDRVLCQNHI